MTVLCAACSMPVLLTLPTHVSLVTSLQMDHLETPVSAMCPGAPHDPMSIPSPCRRHAVRQSSPYCAEILPLGRRPLPPIIGRTPRFADDPKYQPSLTRQRPPDFSIKDLTYNWWVRREGCGALQIGAAAVGMVRFHLGHVRGLSPRSTNHRARAFLHVQAQSDRYEPGPSWRFPVLLVL